MGPACPQVALDWLTRPVVSSRSLSEPTVMWQPRHAQPLSPLPLPPPRITLRTSDERDVTRSRVGAERCRLNQIESGNSAEPRVDCPRALFDVAFRDPVAWHSRAVALVYPASASPTARIVRAVLCLGQEVRTPRLVRNEEDADSRHTSAVSWLSRVEVHNSMCG